MIKITNAVPERQSLGLIGFKSGAGSIAKRGCWVLFAGGARAEVLFAGSRQGSIRRSGRGRTGNYDGRRPWKFITHASENLFEHVSMTGSAQMLAWRRAFPSPG